MPSTRSLHLLPDIEPLRRVCQSIAALDAVLSPDPEFRYYSFDSRWRIDRQLAAMRDEAGAEWFVLFSPAGAVLKGFEPESAMAEPVEQHRRPWPGVLDELPPVFGEILVDPKLGGDRATFCIWREAAWTEWRRGQIRFPQRSNPVMDPTSDGFEADESVADADDPQSTAAMFDPDGSAHLLRVLDGDPVTFARWAEQYYETEIPFIDIRRVFMHRPMTEEIARSLAPHTKYASLVEDLARIGYPIK